MRLGTLCGRDVDVWVWAGRCQIILWKNCGRRMQCGCLCSSMAEEKKGQSSRGGFAGSEIHLLQEISTSWALTRTNKQTQRQIHTDTHTHTYTEKKSLLRNLTKYWRCSVLRYLPSTNNSDIGMWNMGILSSKKFFTFFSWRITVSI